MLPFFFFVFVLQRKMQGSCMKTKGMQFVEQKVCWMHMMMQWLMENVMLEYDNRQMQERYVHYDALKRCLCDAWYECIYGHESPENHLFLLAHSGTQCPMCVVKKVIWTFRLPMTKDETNIQRMCDNMMQTCKSVTRGCRQLSQPTLLRASEARLTSASSKGEKCAESPPTFICGKRRKNWRKPIMKNIPDSGVVFTFEEGISTSHACPKGQQP